MLPIVLLLLDDSTPASLRQGAVSQVLQLAGSDASAFRSAVASLDPAQRTAMESAMRGAVQRPDAQLAQGIGLPTIELRSFG